MMTMGVRSLWLVAHRGDPVHVPENTIASLKSALSKGAQAVEVDLRRTLDGRWVVFHDAGLKRMTGSRGSVSRSALEGLKALWVQGKWKIPSLEEVLAFCSGRGVPVFLDVKVSAQERELARLLRRSGGSAGIWVGAGSVASLKRWRECWRKGPLFWVTGYRTAITPRRISLGKRLQLTGLAAYQGRVSPAVVDRVHRAGLQLFVWTARSGSDLRRLTSLGVDGIMNELWPPPRLT